MKKMKEYFSDLDAAVLTSRRVIFLELLAGFFFGIVVGILIAPPRRLKVGCNNGNMSTTDGGCECGCSCQEEDK